VILFSESGNAALRLVLNESHLHIRAPQASVKAETLAQADKLPWFWWSASCWSTDGAVVAWQARKQRLSGGAKRRWRRSKEEKHSRRRKVSCRGFGGAHRAGRLTVLWLLGRHGSSV
jgi:hypothetical protein